MRVKEKLVIPSKASIIIGMDEAGRAARSRASLAQPAFVIGIDEAGRGPLAGPVVVAGVKMRLGRLSPKFFSGLKDSKKLSAKQREVWFRKIVNSRNLEWAVAKIWPKTIDRINIARAVNLGAFRVYKKLSFSQRSVYRTVLPFAVLDGSLYLPSVIPQKTIIKGDEKIKLIAAASVIAKVARDRIMVRLHKKYQDYGFDIHKGYGTKLHRESLKKFGPSSMHRKSFKLKSR